MAIGLALTAVFNSTILKQENNLINNGSHAEIFLFESTEKDMFSEVSLAIKQVARRVFSVN